MTACTTIADFTRPRVRSDPHRLARRSCAGPGRPNPYPAVEELVTTAHRAKVERVGTIPSLGKIRRLTRIADRAGFIRVAAIDHPENYLALFDQDISKVGFAEIVESKAELLQAMAWHSSALLLDPVWSLGQAIYTAYAPADVGLISGVEKLSYAPGGDTTGWGTELAVRPAWPVSKVAAIGADGVKIVVFYRPDLEEVSQKQHASSPSSPPSVSPTKCR